MTTGTERYYEQRAPEYDAVYEKRERQTDLAALGDLIELALTGRRVLDVAAGTGWWPARYADAAAAVLVTDVNDGPLAVARDRRTWPDHVGFALADAFALDEVPGGFDAAFVGFLWSHVTVDRLDELIAGLARRLEPSATVLLVDNVYVEGSSSPITRTDAAGNTYQERRLADGSTWEVMKNFPTDADLRAHLSPHAAELTIHRLPHFWLAALTTRSG